MGTQEQEQEPQRAGVWCPALSGGHDVPGAGVLGSVALYIYVRDGLFLFGGGQGAGRGVVSKLA